MLPLDPLNEESCGMSDTYDQQFSYICCLDDQVKDIVQDADSNGGSRHW